MPAADRSVDIVAFLSEHLRDIVRRRVREVAGLALISLALLGAIALATWSVQDPSLSHATHKPTLNLLGYPGAIFSDLAMQLLGLAAVALLAPEALLGWRLLTHRELGDKWRSLMWVLTTLLWAAFASTLPIIGSWPLPTGLGGVFGDALLRGPAALTGGSLGFVGSIVAGVVTGFAALLTTAIAADIRIPVRDPAEEIEEEAIAEEDDEEEADRASPWLGMIVHALLSMKTRLWLLLRPSPRKPI
ncbi:MAG TPA: DNA translocase FtsK 4TM domain-containing protein, partial [Pseudolabrys sp.]|nr:DNA translocase FtsK 4TM domain-containing protein [Pseudolabrys sp.]